MSRVNRGLGIDLNREFNPYLLGGGGKVNEAVSAGSGDSTAVVDRKSSEGEFDPISNKDGDDGDFSPPVEALKALNL
ncbi:unnamed protein product [Linum trigynum]|uniref:Uncharacterized protein n=1 Tax=Linum trigynum TaxID=586398 RepID=A0AAV2CLE2_9ROSI